MAYKLDNAYLERINNAIVIVPDLTVHKVHYFIEIENGILGEYTPEQTLLANDFRGESSKINNLIDKKVIFMPLKTEPESTKWMVFKHKTNRALLEFEVSKIDKATDIEKVVSRINAEVYNPFTKKEAKRVNHFVRRYVYRNSRLIYK